MFILLLLLLIIFPTFIPILSVPILLASLTKLLLLFWLLLLLLLLLLLRALARAAAVSDNVDKASGRFSGIVLSSSLRWVGTIAAGPLLLLELVLVLALALVPLGITKRGLPAWFMLLLLKLLAFTLTLVLLGP